jgi:phage shock protein PspC (stress-responsive transcriptional regulator)
LSKEKINKIKIMNKTVTINISGIIFHIEEDAFEKLSKYLSTIKGFFNKTDGGNEIMGDIEARIAEMLQGKTSAIKQVVLMADVDSVIETMGKPEQFADDQGYESNQQNSQDNQQTSSSETPVKKRLFRDPDHKAIGGVCSGIAAYFDVDIIWIRLAMFLLIFFGGLSLWVYIILWIVIPIAKTTADKLAMKGERIDINNISKSVKEEAEHLKKRMEKYGHDIRNSNEAGNFFDRLGDFIKDFFIMFSKFFARIIGLVLLIFGVFFMLGLLSTIFGFSVMGTNAEFNDWINLIFMERSHYSLGMFGIILFFGVPVLMMIYGGVKLLFKIRYSNKWLNISAGMIWLAGFLLALFVGIKTGKDFGEGGKVKDPMLIKSKSDTLYLTLNTGKDFLTNLNLNEDDIEEFDHKGRHMNIRSRNNEYMIAKNDKSKFIVGHASLSIVPSTSDNFELYVIKKARGEDKRSAVERARVIEYHVEQKDSLISFDELFTVPALEKFRVQEVQVILKVPRNKVVHLDKSLEHFISDVENVTNTYDGDMVGRRWIMTKEGLKCIDCAGLKMNDASEDEDIPTQPVPPKPPGLPGVINIKDKDANVNIGKDGIDIKSKDGDVKINKDGIHIDTKENKKGK